MSTKRLEKSEIKSMLSPLPNLTLREMTEIWVEIILDRTQGNRLHAAEILKIAATSLRRHIKNKPIVVAEAKRGRRLRGKQSNKSLKEKFIRFRALLKSTKDVDSSFTDIDGKPE